jgi:hypothetical protein
LDTGGKTNRECSDAHFTRAVIAAVTVTTVVRRPGVTRRAHNNLSRFAQRSKLLLPNTFFSGMSYNFAARTHTFVM